MNILFRSSIYKKIYKNRFFPAFHMKIFFILLSTFTDFVKNQRH